MSLDLRLPKITEKSTEGQLVQIRSYLYQLTDQLKFAFDTIDGKVTSSGVVAGADNQTKMPSEQEAIGYFNEIKSLIIKSADIVNAYYTKINERLEGLYVAESDFGTYTEQTRNTIDANSQRVDQLFENEQTILSAVEGIDDWILKTEGCIRTGELYRDENGNPVIGIEIGQKNEVNGVEVFNKYAQFIANKLTFFDKYGEPLAYISDYKLYITHVEITSSLTMGGFVETVLADKSIVKKWVGGG